MLPKTLEELITARDKLLEEQKKEPLDIPTRQELEWIEKQIRDLSKEQKVTSDGLSREDKVKRIYEVIADKKLKQGCILKNIFLGETTIIGYGIQKPGFIKFYDVLTEFDGFDTIREDYIRSDSIIGHPVMIGDVLEWLFNIYNSNKHIGAGMKLMQTWKLKRKTIQKQTDDCIDYVYSLLETTHDHTSF